MTAKRFLSHTYCSIYLFALLALIPASGQADDSSGLFSSVNSSSLALAATPSMDDWRRTMSKTAFPKPGCFKATHPSSTWTEVPCQSPPNVAHVVATKYAQSASGALTSSAISPATVGGAPNSDFVATTTQHITWAEGSFPSVTGVTGTGNYSLQLNAEPEPTAGQGLCINAQHSSNCHRWQQFYYQQPWIFSQYWLLGYGDNTVDSGTCTSNPCSGNRWMCPQGWTANNTTSHACFRNGNGFWVNEIENIPLSDLANLTLIGKATSTADQIFLSTGNGTLYTAIDALESLNLSQWWNQAEFNVFGWSEGQTADLGPNAVVTVQLITDTTPASSATVGYGTFTAEMNNMTLVPGSQYVLGGSQPGIQFTEGYVGAPSPGGPIQTPNIVAVQSNNNRLYLYNNGQQINTSEGMLAGTIPSWVMSENGPLPKIAFQANNNHLFLYDMNTWPPVDTGKLMKAGTSPSVTQIANQYQVPVGYVIVAYQNRSGMLCLYQSDTGQEHCTSGNMTGSPSIAWVANQTNYGNYVVAFHSSADNKCYVYSGSSGGFSKCNSGEPTMYAGTSPSIVEYPSYNNTYVTAFQGSDTNLYLYWPGGGGNQYLGMKMGTNPSVTILNDGSIAYAFQANTGFLFTSIEGVITNTQLVPGFPQMANHASPIILPFPKFGYEVAFESSDTYLYLDKSGTPFNAWLGMDTPP
jgi:hypothetical protein